MMDWTDRHCRYFHRLLARDAVLYTEMVTADAVIYGDRARLLSFDPSEHPIALQLGGSDPLKLAQAARIGADLGYNEINLNIGCPSDRVQEGRFGACLMAEPSRVADCVGAMKAAVDIDVSVKCRIGIDDQDSEEGLAHFVDTVSRAPCRTFIVHARKAWLDGLSPKENRDVPPLHYDRVYRLKRARSDLEIVINGGITSVEACKLHLEHTDGVMLGRAAYQSPFVLAQAQHVLMSPGEPVVQRADILRALLPYVARHLGRGGRLNNVTRHVLGLYRGVRGGRAFRRYLSENAVGPEAGVDVLEDAISLVSRVQERESAELGS